MVRSAAKLRVSNHEAATSFETPRFARLLRMRRNYALRASAPSIMSTVFCKP